MIIVREVKIPLSTDFTDVKALVVKRLGLSEKAVVTASLFKKAIDARKKDDVFYSCAFLIEGSDEKGLLVKLKKYKAEKYTAKEYVFPTAATKKQVIVVGFGPAGMFAALSLAKAGLCPIVLERGKDADRRKADVELFFGGNALNPESNVQFGEGGAGTFSDGKLNTGIKDERIRVVLETFANHGAGQSILYDAKPHIGTDVLINVVKSIRGEIISLGGKVLFEHKVTDIKVKNGRVVGLTAATPKGNVEFSCDNVILAPGHSARDTFQMLKALKVNLEPKPFAVGTRIEHLQGDINRSQYGKFADKLPSADYRLATHLKNGRGVFTFCMCPGGEVVNASSEQGGIAVNGMSNNARNGVNANSALLVGVEVADYYKGDVLDGIAFQREIEQKAFKAGDGKPICQTLGNFLGVTEENAPTTVVPSVKTGGTVGDIGDCLPVFVTDALKEGILLLDKRLGGFADKAAVLTAPETRSSSPIRIVRDALGVSSVEGLYPCGEGAGYAGGITSAAVDGLKTAEQVLSCD